MSDCFVFCQIFYREFSGPALIARMRARRGRYAIFDAREVPYGVREICGGYFSGRPNQNQQQRGCDETSYANMQKFDEKIAGLFRSHGGVLLQAPIGAGLSSQ
jgi:hypothetical protein